MAGPGGDPGQEARRLAGIWRPWGSLSTRPLNRLNRGGWLWRCHTLVINWSRRRCTSTSWYMSAGLVPISTEPSKRIPARRRPPGRGRSRVSAATAAIRWDRRRPASGSSCRRRGRGRPPASLYQPDVGSWSLAGQPAWGRDRRSRVRKPVRGVNWRRARDPVRSRGNSERQCRRRQGAGGRNPTDVHARPRRDPGGFDHGDHQPRRFRLVGRWVDLGQRLLRVERVPHHPAAHARMGQNRDHPPPQLLGPSGSSIVPGAVRLLAGIALYAWLLAPDGTSPRCGETG